MNENEEFKKKWEETYESLREQRSIPQMMLDALDAVREVLESYRDSLNAKKQDKVMPHIKESLRALAGEKHSSRKAAYQAAVFVRKAYAVRLDETTAKASMGDRDAAGMVMKEMTDETLALRALGYGIDDYNPMFLQAKVKLPPLVRFEKMTPAPVYEPLKDLKPLKKRARTSA